MTQSHCESSPGSLVWRTTRYISLGDRLRSYALTWCMPNNDDDDDAMNAEQRQMAANLWTKLIDLSL